jgi:hypothetical protein
MIRTDFGRKMVAPSALFRGNLMRARVTWDSLKEEATVLRLPPADQQHGRWQSDSGNMRFD